ncbi:MAG: glutathione S-transferase N-terminal domain-containing protein [Rhodanobacter sp.]
MPRGDPRTPALLTMNPGGRVPLLVEDGWSLPENVATLSYLADRFPKRSSAAEGREAAPR